MKTVKAISILPSGEKILEEHTLRTEYFIQNNEHILPPHGFLAGMSITQVHVNNINIAFFNLMTTICGEKFLEKMSVITNQKITYQLDMDINHDFQNSDIPDLLVQVGKNDMLKELKTINFDDIFEATSKEMLQTENISDQWVILWRCMEYIYDKCDLIHTISYYSSVYNILNYLFVIQDSRDFQYYLSSRIVEKLNNFFHESKNYSTSNLGIRACLKERKKLPMLETLFKYRKTGINLPTPTPEFASECQNFILYGKFTTWPDVTPSTIPFSDNPEDGLIFRLYLGIYLIAHNRMLDEQVRHNLKKDLNPIFKNLIEAFDNLKITIDALNMPPDKYLPIPFMRTASEEIDRDIRKIYNVIYCDSVMVAISKLNENFLKALCPQK